MSILRKELDWNVPINSFMATIVDVARLAGVSKSTVSNVITGSVRVGDATKAKVQGAIEALGFIPSSNATNLRRTHSNEIGVVLSDLGNSIHSDILNGICHTMQRGNYFVNVVFTNGSALVEQEKIDMLLGKHPAGLIIISCQDDDAAYFKKRFDGCAIPVFFLLTRPQKIRCNTAAFETRDMVSRITERLLALGYAHPSLVCGHTGCTAEREAMEGFLEVFARRGKEPTQSSVCKTLMTKEDVFRVTVSKYQYNVPDAIIATSPAMVKGLLETAYVFSKKVGEDIIIICLGDEGWCRANQLSGVMTTSLNCVSMGSTVAKALIARITARRDDRDGQIVIRDSFDVDAIPAPAAKAKPPRLILRQNVIHILAPRLQATEALDHLSRFFESANRNATVNIHLTEQPADVLKTILDEQQAQKSLYDMYLFDSAWLSYVASHAMLRDITDLAAGMDPPACLEGHRSHCSHMGRQYGVPLVEGCQLIFYRRDIFTHPAIAKSYREQTGHALHTPRTWTEFRNICRFFTRSCNPQSPVEYGTSFGLRRPEQLIALVLPFLWSANARLFDDNNQPLLDTPAFRRGIELFLQTVQYANPRSIEQTMLDSTMDLIEGKCAMAVSFSEYTSHMYAAHQADEKIGFCMLPGKASVFAGWNFGVSNYTDHTEIVEKYLNWTTDPAVNYYLAILSGQTISKQTHQNNELLQLYPWLSITEEAAKHYVARRTPSAREIGVLNPIRVDGIITNILYDVIRYGGDLSQSLKKAQSFAQNMVDNTTATTARLRWPR